MKQLKLFEGNWFVSIVICFAIAGAAFFFCSQQEPADAQEITAETTIQTEDTSIHL